MIFIMEKPNSISPYTLARARFATSNKTAKQVIQIALFTVSQNCMITAAATISAGNPIKDP